MLKFLWSLDVGIWRFLPPPWRRASPAIAQLAFATFARAMRAAENLPAASFHAVTDDFAAAMIAFRRDHLDRAFETIEDMGLTLRCYLKGFVVIVSAVFTFSHNFISPPKTKLRAVFILIAAASAASSSSANHQTSTSKFQRNFNQQTPKQKRPDFGIDVWSFSGC